MRWTRISFPSTARMASAIVLIIAGGAATLGLWYRHNSLRFVEASRDALNGMVATPVAQHLVVRNVSVWDSLADHLRNDATVEVRDGRMVALRAAGDAIPAGAVVVNGKGKTFIPGLIDTHVHLMFESGPDLLTRGPAMLREC